MKYEDGIVMSINRNKATLLTKKGEFVEVRTNKKHIQIGQEFSGIIAENLPFYRYSMIAASILLILFMGGGAYAYYSPVSDITVSINPKIKLQGNRWNKIIKTIPLNGDGEKVLKNINVKNKNVEQGLDLIVDEAKKENFINDDYVKSGKIIEVTVESKGDLKIDLSNFKSDLEKKNLRIRINNGQEKMKKESELESVKEKNNANVIENNNTTNINDKINDNIKTEDKNSIKKDEKTSINSSDKSENSNVKEQDNKDKINNDIMNKNNNSEQSKNSSKPKEENKSKSEDSEKKMDKKESNQSPNNENSNAKIKEENNKENKSKK